MTPKLDMMRYLIAVLTIMIVAALPSASAWAQDSGAGASVGVPEAKPALKSAFQRPAPIAGAPGEVGQTSPDTTAGGGSWWQWLLASWYTLWQWLLSMQRDLQKQLTDAIRGLRTDETGTAALVLIAASFLYGVLHAAGPGHGKGVISSYVLANRSTLRRGIVLSFLSAMMQAVSALVIVGTAVIALNATGPELRLKVIPRFEMVSSALIALAGLWFLVTHLRRRYFVPHPVVVMHAVGADVVAQSPHAHDHHHHHGEGCSCGHSHMPDPAALDHKLSFREAVAVIFAVGIRPCTGAIGALIFAWQLKILWAGVVATFVMAIGTAITVSVLASLAVSSRDQAARFASSSWTDGIYNVATIAGCLLVMLVGAGLFWDAMGPVQPF